MSGVATKTPQARRDLLEIASYIGFDSPSTADRFLDAARDAFNLLASMPNMGARREGVAKFPKLRSWPIKGFQHFLIFYLPTRRGIRVLRVLHGARDLDAIFPQD